MRKNDILNDFPELRKAHEEAVAFEKQAALDRHKYISVNCQGKCTFVRLNAPSMLVRLNARTTFVRLNARTPPLVRLNAPSCFRPVRLLF